VPDRREGLVQAGAVVAAGAGEPAVDVDALGSDAERGELFDLDLDILLVGRAARVTDPGGVHPAQCSGYGATSGGVSRNTFTEQSDQRASFRKGCSGGGSPTGTPAERLCGLASPA